MTQTNSPNNTPLPNNNSNEYALIERLTKRLRSLGKGRHLVVVENNENGSITSLTVLGGGKVEHLTKVESQGT